MFAEGIILSRREAEKMIIQAPYIHISLYNPDLKPAILPVNAFRLNVLFQAFDDISYEDENYQAMTEEQALDIIRFVESYSEQTDTIVVNCEAGISRSAGVMAGLCVIYGVKDTFCYTNGKHPNVFCKQMIIKAYGKFYGNS